MHNTLIAQHLQKTFKKRTVVEDVSIQIKSGECVGLLGPNGAGKTGGERRRVEIARALASSPKFMLLDEPFAGVDPISVGDIKQIIRTLCERNIGVLITDHNVRETLDICHRAYIVNKGNILCHGNPQEILENADVRKVYLGQEFVI